MDHGLSVDMDDRHPEHPVLTYGPPGSLDSTEIICPHVFHVDGEFRMWYVGADDNHQRRGGRYALRKSLRTRRSNRRTCGRTSFRNCRYTPRERNATTE